MYIEQKRTLLYYIALLFFLIFKINLNESHSQFCNSSIGVAKHLNYDSRKEQICNNDIIKRGYIKYICKPSNNNNNNNNNNRIRNRKLNHVLTIEDYADESGKNGKNGKTKKHKYNFLSNQHNIVKKHKNNKVTYKNWKVQKISVLNYSVNNISIAPIFWGKNNTNLIIKKWHLRKKNINIPIYLMASTDATIMDINVSPDISSHIETDKTRKMCIKPVENNTSSKLKSNDGDDQKIKTNQHEKKKKSTKRVLSEESKKRMKEKLRSIMIKKWKDVDFRKKMIKSFKKRGAHHNKKISDTIKNKWKNDKDYKLKTLEGQRKYFIKKCKNNNAISSKTREKISRSMKLYWQNKNKYKASQPNNLQSIIKKKKQKKVWENIYSIILNKNVNDFNNYQTFHHNLSINLQAALG
ncbi:conserved Plasmodium protein, unknown function [Plasmodium berghei]|uniref:Uncharacterized protein n=2 Tax=Plasmodium berghei TaxID=5821 RepID=A0A509AH98_PLABA|nr:conserved Plasmodium protein, unknown function [Plasmodium berghei ANKA]SCM21004.1 conserved Plasmodium protein, unknown function [Plasmodium berghei]SCN24406.1 conserved Plasmodium protein, unknown function [Plasmodium berghei]SCO59601.1 conserved Plasmodium protein, unknown function [Plasmodium berghei]SCO60795.1 conserved Plasmodium protein, unknown function [Plasmodium berghei]VUC55285.1 conserved Plasmodium protein, unknown function [Plasmodium berghei ANKA]|eukprot:XP_034421098.1 conserved Plasmodium protein, unknown function [Plasmodium berghei ANKA]